MSDTLTEPRFVRVTGEDNAPACFNPGWLPDIDIDDVAPELADARAEYLRLRDAWQSARAERRELSIQIEQDESNRALALRDAYLTGGDTTPQGESEDLKSRLAEAEARVQGATSAFLEHVNRTIGLVVTMHEVWLGSMEAYERDTDQKIQALLDEVMRLRDTRRNFSRLQHWITRTGVSAARMPADHFPFSEIPLPRSEDKEQEEREMKESMLKIYAGGIAPLPPLDAEQGAQLEQRVLDGPSQAPTESFTLEPDEDDLTDWLMGCGRFDGQPKPDAELVIAVAENNAEMARLLLAAEKRATGDNPRQAVASELSRIAGE